LLKDEYVIWRSVDKTQELDDPVSDRVLSMGRISGIKAIVAEVEERLPKYGVETEEHGEEMDELLGNLGDTWGLDVFRLSEITHWKPLTVTTYAVFQVRTLVLDPKGKC
jgi:hypothetical protein